MTRREAKKFLRSSCSERLCISFLQDPEGKAIFRDSTQPLLSATKKLSGLVSTLLVLLFSSCASTPQKQTSEKNCSVTKTETATDKHLEEGNDPSTPPKPKRWVGF